MKHTNKLKIGRQGIGRRNIVPPHASLLLLFLDPGSGIDKNRIRDKHPGSATLVERLHPRLISVRVGKISPVWLRPAAMQQPWLQQKSVSASLTTCRSKTLLSPPSTPANRVTDNQLPSPPLPLSFFSSTVHITVRYLSYGTVPSQSIPINFS
jgi:hypothetical protein